MPDRHHPSTPGRLRGLRTSLLGGLAALALSSAALAEPLTLERAPSGHLIVQVEIDNTGPYTFLLDTGASHTAIAQPIAEILGFHSAWEEVDDVQSLTTLFSAERFTLWDVRFADLPPVSLNGVVIPVDTTQPHPVAGLLGADAILATRYRLDFANATLTLNSEAPQYADGMVNSQNLLLGEADLSRGMHGVHVMIDSGSARTLINPRLRGQVQNRARGVSYNIDGVESRLESDTGVEAQSVLLRGFQLGGLCLNSVVALQADLDIFDALGWGNQPAMVIGMDVLRHSTVTIDREAGTFEISAADPAHACRGERVQVSASDRREAR